MQSGFSAACLSAYSSRKSCQRGDVQFTDWENTGSLPNDFLQDVITWLAERAFYDNEFNVAQELEHESFAKPIEKGVAVKYYCKGIIPTRYKIQYYVYELVEGKSLHKYYPIPSRDQYPQDTDSRYEIVGGS